MHQCTKHQKPFIKYDICGEIGAKALCEDCYSANEKEIALKIANAVTRGRGGVPAAANTSAPAAEPSNPPAKSSAVLSTPFGETPYGDEDEENIIIREYEEYRLSLIKHIGRRVEFLQRVTNKQLQVIEANVLSSDSDIRLVLILFYLHVIYSI